MNPYKDLITDQNFIIREFDENIDPIELMWHRDNEDRLIEALEHTDWQIQLDNNLPISINQKVFIKKHIWHRAIKGTGKLKLKIIKSV